MARRAHTRQALQAEADRWVEKLKAMGYTLPELPITVYTVGTHFDAAIGSARRYATRQRCEGLAGPSKDGLPIVYVGIRRLTDGDDPVELLIHELLHHVTPELLHSEVYALAAKLRESELTPDELEERLCARRVAAENRARAVREATEDIAIAFEKHGDDLLEALRRSAYPSDRHSLSSPETGRYISAKDLAASRLSSSTTTHPYWGPRRLSNTTRSPSSGRQRLAPDRGEKP